MDNQTKQQAELQSYCAYSKKIAPAPTREASVKITSSSGNTNKMLLNGLKSNVMRAQPASVATLRQRIRRDWSLHNERRCDFVYSSPRARCSRSTAARLCELTSQLIYKIMSKFKKLCCYKISALRELWLVYRYSHLDSYSRTIILTRTSD